MLVCVRVCSVVSEASPSDGGKGFLGCDPHVGPYKASASDVVLWSTHFLICFVGQEPLSSTSRVPRTKGRSDGVKPLHSPATVATGTSFQVELPASKCITLVARILAGMSYRVMMKKSENKLKCQIPCKGDLLMVRPHHAISSLETGTKRKRFTANPPATRM